MTPAPRWLVWTHDRDIDGAPAYLVFAPAEPHAVRIRRRRTIAAGAGLATVAAGVTSVLLGLAAGMTVGLVLAAGAVVLTPDSTYGRQTVRTTWTPLLADLDLARRRAPHLLAELHPLAWDALADQHPVAAGRTQVGATFERQMALRGARLRLHAEVQEQGDGVVDDLMRAA
jgi:hypothetical protein